MLRYIIGLDLDEFIKLLYLSLPFLMKEFPRTLLVCNETECNYRGSQLTLRFILFLCLMRLRHLISFRFLQGITGFDFSHLKHVLNRAELCLMDALQVPYLEKPSLQELQIDADLFFNYYAINGNQFHISFLVDATYHVLCRLLSRSDSKTSMENAT